MKRKKLGAIFMSSLLSVSMVLPTFGGQIYAAEPANEDYAETVSEQDQPETKEELPEESTPETIAETETETAPAPEESEPDSPADVPEEIKTPDSQKQGDKAERSKREASQTDEVILQSTLTAASDSYETGNEPEKALDGQSGTWWHTSWSNWQELPQAITLTLSETADGLYQLRYTPRNDKDMNGTITEFKIEVSYDKMNFTEAANGTWAADQTEKSASFTALDGVSAVRLTALASKGNNSSEDNQYVSAAELNLVCNGTFEKDDSVLIQAVNEGNTYINDNPNLSLETLKERITAGENVLANPLATQEGYDETAAAINEMLTNIGIKTSISGTAGARLYATNGELIQAHGGQISKWGDTYYWYGEDKTDRLKPTGVHLYTSKDLYNWEDRGLVMKTMKSTDEFTDDTYFAELYGDLSEEEQAEVFIHIDYNTAVVERPKVIYNESTGKYVMWYHADGPWNGGDPQSYWKAMAAVAIADEPQGPFKVLGASRLHTSADYTGDEKDYGMARDMNLFVDDDGTGYIIYSSENNATMYISKLNADYTDLAVRDGAVEGVDYTRNFVNWSREAPAMFKYKDKYYLMTSGCTGWNPNPAEYAMADSPLGPWTSMGTPCVGENASTTFDTQSTCIFPVDAANGKFIYMGDRWFNPDNGNDLGDSRYVWLPVEFGQNYTMTIRPTENWTLEELENKDGFTVDSTIENLEMLVSESPDLTVYNQMRVNVTRGNGQTVQSGVEWTIENSVVSYALGFDKMRGQLLDLSGSQEITADITKYQDATVYFVDCGEADEVYYDGFKRLGIQLKNKKADQDYDGTWGLYNPDDVGTHEGNGIFESGYWARTDKNIVYRFTLPAGTYTAYAGFNEWWTASRQAELNIRLVNNADTANETYETLADPAAMNTTSSSRSEIYENGFTLNEDGIVEVRVDKKSGGDPLLAWLGITKKADTKELQNAIINIETEMKEMNKSKYSAELWQQVETALQEAKTVLQTEGISQIKCDEALKKVQDLMEELKKSKEQDKPEPETTPQPETKPEQPETNPNETQKPEEKVYRITYVLNKGKNNTGNPTSYTKSVTLKSPTRKGYLFKGWYTEKTFKNKITSVSGNDITVYAKWTKVTVKKAKMTSVKSKAKGKMTLKFKKVSGASGYEIRYARNKKFKNYKKVLSVKNSKTIKKLSRKKTYYVKVRAFKVDSAGKKVYGKFSSVKQVKIK